MVTDRSFEMDISDTGITRKICPICRRVLWSREDDSDKEAELCTHEVGGEVDTEVWIDSPYLEILERMEFIINELFHFTDLDPEVIFNLFGFEFELYEDDENFRYYLLNELIFEFPGFEFVSYTPVNDSMVSGTSADYFIEDEQRKPLEAYLRNILNELEIIYKRDVESNDDL